MERHGGGRQDVRFAHHEVTQNSPSSTTTTTTTTTQPYHGTLRTVQLRTVQLSQTPTEWGKTSVENPRNMAQGNSQVSHAGGNKTNNKLPQRNICYLSSSQPTTQHNFQEHISQFSSDENLQRNSKDSL